jgi:DnaJ-domain-containing protein 1
MEENEMETTQRRRACRKPAVSSMIRLELNDDAGNPRSVTAGVVDIIEGGCGLELATPLKSGSTVVVRGLRAGVRWCIRRADGTFRAGLQFSAASALDCYEVMQLSPNADQDTVSRVYRMLAARYHPDNRQTGNSAMFLRVSEAHAILGDPEKRARYDESRGVSVMEGRLVGTLRGWGDALRRVS